MFARLRLWQVLVLAGALWVLLVACQVLAATALVAVYNRLWRPAGPQPETVAVPAPLPVASSQPAHVIGPPSAPRPVPVRPAAELVALSAPDRLGASQPSRPGLRLEITAPIPQVVPLLSQSVVIGSGPEAGLRLEGLRPRHAELVVRDGRYLLRDLGGSQTWVQGRLISGPHVVKDGFRLQLGHWQMVFRE